MTALTQAVAIGDNQIYIDAALAAGQVPGYVKIDDELLNVGGQDNLAGTTLVLASPAQEAHDSGATVTYAGRPYDPTFKMALAGAGGEQTIRLLGPYRVDFSDGKVQQVSTGLVIPANASVELSLLGVTDWEVDSDWPPANDRIALGVGATGSDITLVEYQPEQGFGTPNAAGNYEALRPLLPKPFCVVAVASDIWFTFSTTGGGAGALTAGAGDIYALIAEPAA